MADSGAQTIEKTQLYIERSRDGAMERKRWGIFCSDLDLDLTQTL